MSLLIRFYPPEWRSRYGAELAEVATSSPGWHTELDLLRGAIDAWTRTPGGDPMTQRLTKLAAALMILPLFFIGVVVLAAMSGSVEELYLESFFTSPLGEAAVVLGPFAALDLVLIPAVRISVDRSEPAPVVAVTLRLGRFQLLVALVAAAVAVLFLGYYFVENYTLRVPR